jgi:hypothetical protein
MIMMLPFEIRNWACLPKNLRILPHPVHPFKAFGIDGTPLPMANL